MIGHRSGLELLQAGINGRAIDFAKLGTVYLPGGVWRGHQLVYDHWPDLLSGLARRL